MNSNRQLQQNAHQNPDSDVSDVSDFSDGLDDGAATTHTKDDSDSNDSDSDPGSDLNDSDSDPGSDFIEDPPIYAQASKCWKGIPVPTGKEQIPFNSFVLGDDGDVTPPEESSYEESSEDSWITVESSFDSDEFEDDDPLPDAIPSWLSNNHIGVMTAISFQKKRCCHSKTEKSYNVDSGQDEAGNER